MFPVKQSAIKAQVERDLGKDSEQSEPEGIFVNVPCSYEPFHKEETEYRECDAAHTAAYLMYVIEFRVCLGQYIHAVYLQIVMDNTVTEMVQCHDDAGDEFKYIA
jgi:hypothetical protein